MYYNWGNRESLWSPDSCVTVLKTPTAKARGLTMILSDRKLFAISQLLPNNKCVVRFS